MSVVPEFVYNSKSNFSSLKKKERKGRCAKLKNDRKAYKKITPLNFVRDKYHCPKCKRTEFVDYGKTVECTTCLIEFDKELLGKIPDDEILSLQEIKGVLDEFEELKDPEKVRKFFDSLSDDLD
ncbi:hypothetical protein LCGC14_1429020 [marine sediment metagenome]|uniref:Uncharacterized protein n=1 Tax=marine sediment metagenome TaxID=412755 RepID=A0A0F9KA95_9ZZZZ